MYGILLLFAWGFPAAAQAQPAALTLACKGTLTSSMPDSKPETEPFSTGIIVNFATRTVQGLNLPGTDFPVTITAADDVTVMFDGKLTLASSTYRIIGSIDRVTGELQATNSEYDQKEHKNLFEQTYALQCRPAQRMF